jgi:hypothetical protein
MRRRRGCQFRRSGASQIFAGQFTNAEGLADTGRIALTKAERIALAKIERIADSRPFAHNPSLSDADTHANARSDRAEARPNIAG